jgi:hypothetical protein
MTTTISTTAVGRSDDDREADYFLETLEGQNLKASRIKTRHVRVLEIIEANDLDRIARFEAQVRRELPLLEEKRKQYAAAGDARMVAVYDRSIFDAQEGLHRALRRERSIFEARIGRSRIRRRDHQEQLRARCRALPPRRTGRNTRARRTHRSAAKTLAKATADPEPARPNERVALQLGGAA